jgi:hypothetical protein
MDYETTGFQYNLFSFLANRFYFIFSKSIDTRRPY